MSRIVRLLIALCLLSGAPVLAYADTKYNEERGQLLYATHCNTCHTSQVHWREQKKVTDWNSLVMQVRHWQGIAALGWSEDEINDVAHYLNVMFYSYKDTAQGKNPWQLLYKN
jgi:mono/diheme cytochrome c family protein